MNTKALFLFEPSLYGNATVRRIENGEIIELSPQCDAACKYGKPGTMPLVQEYCAISDMMAVDFILRNTGNLDGDYDV